MSGNDRSGENSSVTCIGGLIVGSILAIIICSPVIAEGPTIAGYREEAAFPWLPAQCRAVTLYTAHHEACGSCDNRRLRRPNKKNEQFKPPFQLDAAVSGPLLAESGKNSRMLASEPGHFAEMDAGSARPMRVRASTENQAQAALNAYAHSEARQLGNCTTNRTCCFSRSYSC